MPPKHIIPVLAGDDAKLASDQLHELTVGKQGQNNSTDISQGSASKPKRKNWSAAEKEAMAAAKQLAAEAKKLSDKAARAKRKARDLSNTVASNADPDARSLPKPRSKGPADEQPPNDEQKIRLNQQITDSTVGALVKHFFSEHYVA